ncbi:MAG: phosphatidate cytidylyltransferase [Asticcacaulis sp.]
MPPSPPESAPKASTGRELLLRITSAVVLIAIALAVTALGSWYFLVLVSIGVALLCIEWGIMAAPNTAGRMSVAVALAALGGLFVAWLEHPVLAVLILLFGALCAGLFAYRLKSAWADAAYGVMYIGTPALVLLWLRNTAHGLDWVMFAFLIAWAADSAAFLVGRMIGGPKLWRRYSPNKTWSGFAGGMIAGMLTAATLADLTHLFKHDTSASFVGLLTALATMAGDLWESALKRRFGVKDAGSLIPGHGGLLDRVDGLMFAIVAIGGIRLLILLGTEI